MKILVDLDGVLADVIGGAAKLHGKDQALVTEWDIARCWGIPPEEFWAPLGRSFWAGLEPTPECFDLLTYLEGAVGIDNLCLLTSPPLTGGAVEGKLDWVRKRLPAYSRRFLIGPRKEFCAGPDRLLIDDADHNVIEFQKAGGKAVLFPRPWNANSCLAYRGLDVVLQYLASTNLTPW